MGEYLGSTTEASLIQGYVNKLPLHSPFPTSYVREDTGNKLHHVVTILGHMKCVERSGTVKERGRDVIIWKRQFNPLDDIKRHKSRETIARHPKCNSCHYTQQGTVGCLISEAYQQALWGR